MSLNYEHIDQLIQNIGIKLGEVIESFEQTIFETYIHIRNRYNLHGQDTIYSLNQDIRKKYVNFDPKYRERILLIIEQIYIIFDKSIKNESIDKFLSPSSFQSRREYINANISTNFQITDTLFSDQELKDLSIIPIFN